MKLQIRLFARAKDIAGTDRFELEIAGPATVADLRNALAEQFPDMRTLVPSLLIAIGSEYAEETTPISADSEIACFPPVSGG